MTKQLLLSALALATLALNACSSEPSDWRPDKKVSVDMVPPGTRSDTYFMNTDGNDEATPETQANGGAIPRPINSGVVLDERAKPNPKEVISANAQEIERTESARAKARMNAETTHDNDDKK